MVYLYHLAVGSAHEGDGVVAVGAFVEAHLLLYEFEAVDRLGVEGHEGLESVAAVDVHGLAYGTEAVGGIDVTAVVLVEVEAPVALVLVPVRLEVVDVAAGSVKHLAEETLLGHVEGGHLEEVVDAVLEHHAVPLGTLGRVDQLPAFC